MNYAVASKLPAPLILLPGNRNHVNSYRCFMPLILLLIALCWGADAQEANTPAGAAAFVLKEVYDPVGQIPFRSGQAPLGMVEIQGVSAGPFKAE